MKDSWNQFIIQNEGDFLQSFEWGEFQERLGRKIWRIETEKAKGLIIKHDLPWKKNYLYCPRGPIGQPDDLFLEEIRKIAKEEKSIFLKIEPVNQIKLTGLRESQKQVQFSETIVISLDKSDQELLNQFHQKTRYNIRLGEKKGLKAEIFDDNTRIDSFLELLKKTTKRDRFYSHPEEYYRKMVDVLGGKNLKMILVRYEDRYIAGGIYSFFNNKVVYLHGASDYDYRNLMAPYYLQWQAILKAKELGFKYYDFGGINQNKWPGVTRFKRGFNGKEIKYPGAFDLTFNKFWYIIYLVGRKIL